VSGLVEQDGDKEQAVIVYEGSVGGVFSNRKPPTVAYAMAPVLHVAREGDESLDR
jgi:hypothetical protein